MGENVDMPLEEKVVYLTSPSNIPTSPVQHCLMRSCKVMLAEVPVWYTAVVPLPLALPDILQRLKSNYYRHVDALQHDAGTIASNAELYNGAGSDAAKTAAGEALIFRMLREATD
jgi:hypothetical protein